MSHLNLFLNPFSLNLPWRSLSYIVLKTCLTIIFILNFLTNENPPSEISIQLLDDFLDNFFYPFIDSTPCHDPISFFNKKYHIFKNEGRIPNAIYLFMRHCSPFLLELYTATTQHTKAWWVSLSLKLKYQV